MQKLWQHAHLQVLLFAWPLIVHIIMRNNSICDAHLQVLLFAWPLIVHIIMRNNSICGVGRQDHCQCEKNEEGQDICYITGCCIKMLNFSDKEFLDTVCFYTPSSLHAPANQHQQFEDILFASSRPANKRSKQQQQQQHLHVIVTTPAPPTTISSAPVSSSLSLSSSSSSSISMRCSVNKKNRYRSWVHSRMQLNHHVAGNNNGRRVSNSGAMLLSNSNPHQQQQQHAKMVAASSSSSSYSVARSSSNNNNNDNVSASTSASLYQQHQQQQQQQQPGFSLEEEAENVRSLIEMYVWDVLCSRKWAESMKMEVHIF